MIEYVVSFVVCFYMTLMYSLSFFKICNKTFEIKNLISLSILALFVFFVNFIDYPLIRMMCIFILILINCQISIKKNYNETINMTIIVYLFNLLIDIVMAFILNYFNINFPLGYSMLIKNVYSIILSSFMFFILLVRPFKETIIKIVNILSKTKIIYYFLIASLVMSIYVITYYIVTFGIPLLYCLMLLMLSMFLSFLLVVNVYKRNKLIKTNENIIKTNKMYGDIIENNNIYYHNLKNKLLSIKSTGNIITKEIINEMLNNDIYNYVIKKEIYKVPNIFISFFCEKLYYYKNNVIVFNSTNKDYYKKIKSKTYLNLCESLGILLDNAIEATEKIEDGYIIIKFFEKNKEIFCMIKNNFENQINMDKIGEKSYSTKKIKSGYGIFSLLGNEKNGLKVYVNEFEFASIIKII